METNDAFIYLNFDPNESLNMNANQQENQKITQNIQTIIAYSTTCLYNIQNKTQKKEKLAYILNPQQGIIYKVLPMKLNNSIEQIETYLLKCIARKLDIPHDYLSFLSYSNQNCPVLMVNQKQPTLESFIYKKVKKTN